MGRYLYCIAVLFLVAFSNGNAQIAPSNITLELIPSAQSVIEGNDFMFSCNSTESLNISILIDGSNSSNKFDRIINDKGLNMIKSFDIIDSDFFVVNFSLANTTYADNGTVFTCVGVGNDTQYNSTDFTLQVYYPPRLNSGDNMTEIYEFETGFPILLNASVLMANPPIESFNITYDATNTTGINATTTEAAGMVTIMSPVPSNRGNYTFNATNSIGSTTYTYRTFIGGAAGELNITCDQTTVDDRAIINCTANDASDAPALGVYISVPGLVDQYYVQFTEVPAVGLTLIPVNVSLNEVSAAEYNLYIESVNKISNISVLNEAYYIPGLFVGASINTTNSTIIEGGNFTFDCSTPPELQNYTTSFTVLVNDLSADDRIVTDGTVTKGTQSFVFTKTSYLDDGAVFVCVANGTIRSNNLNITILYAPKYFNVLETEALVSDTPGMLSLNMSSNPPPTFAMWTLNGVLLLNGTNRIMYNASQIEFTSVIVNDTGNYTVIAGNEIGNASFSFMAEVYYAPIIEVTDQLFGYYNTSFVLSIKIEANPSNLTTVWYKGDEELVSGNGTIVNDNNITFASLAPSDNATYTVHVNNSIGGSMEAISLGVYFGPIFAQLTNDTVWMEHATDSNFSYICEVMSSFPAVAEFNFTSTESEDLDVIKNETKSIQLRVTKASQKNRQNYTCLGETGYTSGYTTFQTFVGGAPDGVNVNVTISRDNGKFNFFITIFDSSDAPARNLLYTNPTTNKNDSIEIPYPLFDGMSYTPVDEFLSLEESELTGGEDYLVVYANNSLGEHFVANISILSIPTITPGPSPTKPVKKSKGAAIAAGILVPVCVIAVVVGVAVVVYFYMKNKRNSYGFSALKSMSNDNERDATITTYGTGQINE